MYKITLDLPGTPKSGEGSEVDIAGLGRLQNGGTYEVSDADAEAFRNMNSRPVESGTTPSGETLYETQPGPTLLQAFKGHDYIKVEKVNTQEGSN